MAAKIVGSRQICNWINSGQFGHIQDRVLARNRPNGYTGAMFMFGFRDIFVKKWNRYVECKV